MSGRSLRNFGGRVQTSRSDRNFASARRESYQNLFARLCRHSRMQLPAALVAVLMSVKFAMGQ